MVKVKKILAVLAVSIITITNSFAYNLIDFFSDYVDLYSKMSEIKIPNSYRYINLNFKGLSGQNYDIMQKAVYLDLFPNAKIKINPNLQVTQKLGVGILKYKFKKGIFTYQSNQLADKKRLENQLEQLIKQNKGFFINDKIAKEIYKILKQNYYYPEKLDEKEMRYGAIKGMVNAVADKYTVYYSPKKSKQFMEQLAGEYEGIGAVIKLYKPGEVVILKVFKDSPAQKAGLIKGDIIIAIDGKFISKEATIQDIANMIRGKGGTKVILKIKRGDEILDIPVIRGKVKINSIEIKKEINLPQQFCYLGIGEFNENTYYLLTKSLKNMNFNQCKYLILDLRDNPGGSLIQVIDVLSYFIPANKKVVEIKSRLGEFDYFTTRQSINIANKVNKIFVLINKRTASGGEILAQVLKEYYPHKVILIGEKTYGKGTAQQVVQLPDSSVLKYTFAKWFTFKGTNIDGTGVVPDIKLVDDPKTTGDEVLNFFDTANFSSK